MEKILTVNDVAAVLQVKAITVREMFREKRLRGFKVGKSWRTTEVMLQEDINALARGEAPAELSGALDVQGGPSVTATPAPRAATPKVETPKVETPKVETPQPPRAAPKSPPAGTKDADADEDTQQLLF